VKYAFSEEKIAIKKKWNFIKTAGVLRLKPRQRRTDMKIAIMTGIAVVALSMTMAFLPDSAGAREMRHFGTESCAMTGPGGGKPFKHLDRMQYYLGLSDAQVEKIFRVDQDYREKYFKNRNSYEAVEKLRGEHRKAIEDVLSDVQKERFNKMGPFNRGHSKDGRPGKKFRQ
jgi:hypothetical protein